MWGSQRLAPSSLVIYPWGWDFVHWPCRQDLPPSLPLEHNYNPGMHATLRTCQLANGHLPLSRSQLDPVHILRHQLTDCLSCPSMVGLTLQGGQRYNSMHGKCNTIKHMPAVLHGPCGSQHSEWLILKLTPSELISNFDTSN